MNYGADTWVPAMWELCLGARQALGRLAFRHWYNWLCAAFAPGGQMMLSELKREIESLEERLTKVRDYL